MALRRIDEGASRSLGRICGRGIAQASRGLACEPHDATCNLQVAILGAETLRLDPEHLLRIEVRRLSVVRWVLIGVYRCTVVDENPSQCRPGQRQHPARSVAQQVFQFSPCRRPAAPWPATDHPAEKLIEVLF